MFSKGNALIITEDYDSTDPDDRAAGGQFNIHFWGKKPKSIKELELLDVDYTDFDGNRGNSQIFGTRVDGTKFGPYMVPPMGDGEIQWIKPKDASDVLELNIKFSGSGAIP